MSTSSDTARATQEMRGQLLWNPCYCFRLCTAESHVSWGTAAMNCLVGALM